MDQDELEDLIKLMIVFQARSESESVPITGSKLYARLSELLGTFAFKFSDPFDPILICSNRDAKESQAQLLFAQKIILLHEEERRLKNSSKEILESDWTTDRLGIIRNEIVETSKNLRPIPTGTEQLLEPWLRKKYEEALEVVEDVKKDLNWELEAEKSRESLNKIWEKYEVLESGDGKKYIVDPDGMRHEITDSKLSVFLDKGPGSKVLSPDHDYENGEDC